MTARGRRTEPSAVRARGDGLAPASALGPARAASAGTSRAASAGTSRAATPAAPGAAGTTGGVRAVARAAAILKSFSRERPELALSDVAAQAGLDKGTTRRLLVTLRDAGFIRQDAATQHYSLGHALLKLADGVPRSSLREACLPILQRVARETGTTAFLSVVHDDAAFCVERVHGNQPIQVNWWAPGQYLPLNCGAGPRLLLAFLPPADLERLAARPLQALTPRSQTKWPALRRHLATIRARGWERTADDVAVGLAALAVPVRDAQGTVVAAMSIGGLTHHVTGSGQPALLACLREAAAELAQRTA
jgi:IclR family transcriptional regulator, KDG regulon repressor